ncbi:MAG: hypothetical protein ABEJ65_02505, partial [bacterium]
MGTYKITDLEEGAVFDCPIFTPTGERLADPFTVLDEERLKQIARWGIQEIRAEADPLSENEKKVYRGRAQGEDVSVEDFKQEAEPEDEREAEPEDETEGEEPSRPHSATERTRYTSPTLKNQVRNSYE